MCFRRTAKQLFTVATAMASTLGWAKVADAQLVPGTPYQRTYSSITYTDLPSPISLSCAVDEGEFAVNLPFAFRFYESTFTSISVGANGAIAFPSGTAITYENNQAGSTAVPNGFIGAVWDDLQVHAASNGCIAYQVQGNTPNRTLTVEWRRIGRYLESGISMSFQLRLFEGDAARFEIDYGPVTGSGSVSATMGMEDPAGGRPINFHSSNCNSTCSQGDVASLSNTRVTLVQDPGVELQALSVAGPALAFIGALTGVEASMRNLHGNPIGPFMVEILASKDRSFTSPVSVGTRQLTLSAFQTLAFSVDATLPASLGEGQIFLRLYVDSLNAVTEVDETNNTVNSTAPTRLLLGRADLAVESVTSSSQNLQAGSSVTVYSRIRNVGGEPATDVTVTTMLSSNPVITAQDLELDDMILSLAAGETVTTTQTVTIPPGTNSGSYYLGVLADPSNALDELSESNNGRAAFRPVQVTGAALAILTQALPTAYVRVSYVAVFAATGSGSQVSWEIVQGRLPQGIGLVAGTGELFGRPTSAETQSFTVQVTSDGRTATRQLTLAVSDPSEPLTIVTRSVPAGVVGQEYDFALVATGGQADATLTWTATGLPEGLEVDESGTLVGTPVAPSATTATVMVTNGTQQATRELELEVRENANLLIIPNVLSTARFGEAYEAQLEASGGLPPVTWVVQLGRLPAGISLNPSGLLSGTPSQVGIFRFVVEARDAAAGTLAARDVNSFELRVVDSEGFVIETATLPDATINKGYDARVVASGGLPPYDWTVEKGRIPEGLIASVNPATGELLIAGQPTEPGTSDLLIVVKDSQSREATRALSIRVLDAEEVSTAPEESEGCSCRAEAQRTRTNGELLVVVGIAGLFAIRRRKPAC